MTRSRLVTPLAGCVEQPAELQRVAAGSRLGTPPGFWAAFSVFAPGGACARPCPVRCFRVLGSSPGSPSSPASGAAAKPSKPFCTPGRSSGAAGRGCADRVRTGTCSSCTCASGTSPSTTALRVRGRGRRPSRRRLRTRATRPSARVKKRREEDGLKNLFGRKPNPLKPRSSNRQNYPVFILALTMCGVSMVRRAVIGRVG